MKYDVHLLAHQVHGWAWAAMFLAAGHGLYPDIHVADIWDRSLGNHAFTIVLFRLRSKSRKRNFRKFMPRMYR